MTLPKLEGNGEESLAGYRGRWVLVNFWASWCPPCRGEAPALEVFQRRHGNAEFTILGIDSRDLSEDGEAFVDRYGISYPQLRDGNGSAAHDFGASAFPENFLIDPHGRVRLMWKGPVTLDALNEEVVPLLHQKKGPNGARFQSLPKGGGMSTIYTVEEGTGYHRSVATRIRRLALEVGDLVEIDGRRYEVVPDRMGGVTIEPSITPMAELEERWGTKPAPAEDFERPTADDPADGGG